jgi:hypothetical protein
MDSASKIGLFGGIKLSLSTLEVEGAPEMSKWMEQYVLLSTGELSALFKGLDVIHLFRPFKVLSAADAYVSTDKFLQGYGSYVDELKRGELPSPRESQEALTVAMTANPEAFYALPVEGERFILRQRFPVVMIRLHTFSFSEEEFKVKSMTHGKSNVTWGLQFSFPHLYKPAFQSDVFKSSEGEGALNFEIYRKIQRYLRSHSSPVPFVRGEREVNASIRLGYECFPWINSHPSLKQNNLSVRSSS